MTDSRTIAVRYDTFQKFLNHRQVRNRAKELMPAALSPGFFILGVIYASLNRAETWPVDNERLKSSAINGERRLATCLRTDVGVGLGADDLSGSFRMALMTSSVDTGENALSEKPGITWLKVGGGALLVLSLTLVTFSMKNGRNVSTSIKNDDGTLL